jgi:LSD1 subclass zinc finger protein
MTLNKDQHEPEIVVTAVPDSGMVTAVGIEEKQPAFGAGGPPGRGNEPPIPLGHSRFYCSKCRSVRIERRGVGLAPPARRSRACLLGLPLPAFSLSPHCELTIDFHHRTQPYDLPDGATTWRCAGCHTFNSTTPGECEWCTIL